jgi:hypothetical protein
VLLLGRDGKKPEGEADSWVMKFADGHLSIVQAAWPGRDGQDKVRLMGFAAIGKGR